MREKIAFSQIYETDCDNFLLNGIEVHFDGIDEEGYNFVEWNPLFESSDKHDINNYVPVLIPFGEESDHELIAVWNYDDE